MSADGVYYRMKAEEHVQQLREDMEREAPDYRLWVNDESTILARMWHDGSMEISTRRDRRDIWGPPILLNEERTS